MDEKRINFTFFQFVRNYGLCDSFNLTQLQNKSKSNLESLRQSRERFQLQFENVNRADYQQELCDFQSDLVTKED